MKNYLKNQWASQNNWHKYSQCLQPHLYAEVILGHRGKNKKGVSKMLIFFLRPPTHFPSLWLHVRSVQVKLGGKNRERHFRTGKHNGNAGGAGYSVAWLWTLSPGWVSWCWASCFGVWITARLCSGSAGPGWALLSYAAGTTTPEQNKTNSRRGWGCRTKHMKEASCLSCVSVFLCYWS